MFKSELTAGRAKGKNQKKGYIPYCQLQLTYVDCLNLKKNTYFLRKMGDVSNS